MGLWRALLSRGCRRRSTFVSPYSSFSSLSTGNQKEATPWLLAPIFNQEAQMDASMGPFLGYSAERKKLYCNGSKEMLQMPTPSGALLGLAEIWPLEPAHEKKWLSGPDDVKEPWLGLLKGCSSKNVQVSDLSLFLRNSTLQMPGLYGSKDFTMEADSVKRKRKKKMNKHKHRKLRRLARKSKK